MNFYPGILRNKNIISEGPGYLIVSSFCARIIFPVFLIFFLNCQITAQTNLGTDFWIAFPPNSTVSESTLKIFISSETSVSGNIYSAFPGINQTFNVIPGIVKEITIPSEVSLSDGLENKGIRITTSSPVCIYGLNHRTASTDAYLGLPVSSLGTDYCIISYTTIYNTYPSSFSIVATHDATHVTMHNHQTDIISNITLNTGQTYMCSTVNASEDLSGSTITSDFPIAVFGSNMTTNIPLDCFAADHLVEMMIPVNAWGKDFVTVALAGRDGSGDVFRILASENGTQVSINGIFITTINNEEFYETNLAGYNSITTSKPALLTQFAKGIECSGNITGDPFMMQIIPYQQFLTQYTVCTVSGYTSHWTNIVASENALNNIYKDGVLIPGSVFTQIAGTNFYGAQLTIAEGSHTFISTAPFGVSIYGWGQADSYGYSGGCSMSAVATVQNVTITPDTAYGTLNITNVCFNATVTDNLNNPVPDILVDFHIGGINPVTGNGYTDSNGHTSFCYTQTGTTPGTDSVYAVASSISSAISRTIWDNIPCINPSDGGTISMNQSHCGSFTPNGLVNLSSPTGYQGTPEYMWQSSIISDSTGFIDIPGSDTTNYSPGDVSLTTWFRRLTRVSCKTDWLNAAISNVVEITINPILTAGVSISPSSNPYCEGSQVTLTAIPLNEGSNPVYQWKLNGINAGTNSSSFTLNPSTGDSVQCFLTSGLICVSGNPASSSKIILLPDTTHPAGISISSSVNPFCSGKIVTLTATAINGGTNPFYQWKVNGVSTGPNSASFSFSPSANDIIQCNLTSNLFCVSGNPSTSASIVLNEIPSPVVTFSSCFDTVTDLNAKPIILKGGIPSGGTYSGPGVNSVTGVFSPTNAGIGTKTINYSYTNAGLCNDAKSKYITVLPAHVFTCGNLYNDIRDNKSYQTVQIGTQCWFAENLRYGTMINNNLNQRDNCLVEKYCLNNLSADCEQGNANFYQWDEMMQYSEIPGDKGLCPASWHIPTDTEWQTLFTNWINNAFAGAHLKFTGFSGFNASLSGASLQNMNWNYQNFAAFLWTSTSHGPYKAWARAMNSINFSVSAYPSVRSNAFSVRCVKD